METSHSILQLVERVALGIELLAVTIIVLVIATATTRYVVAFASRRVTTTTYKEYRARVARALLLGLEILVAADIIRTVALEPSIMNVAILGILVLIRTILSWTLVVEIEERWPWQPPRAGQQRSGSGAE